VDFGFRIVDMREDKMNIKHSRLLCIVLITSIPLAIAGLFLLRNEFPGSEPLFGNPVLPWRDVFLASSLLTAIVACALSFLLQVPLIYIGRSTSRVIPIRISTGLALILVTWAAIFVAEFSLRTRFFALWDHTLGFGRIVSTSSIVLGVFSTLFILLSSFHPAMNKKPA